MAEVARGRNDALRELIERYTDALHSFIYRHTGGQDVDDLFQDTWLRVTRARRSFDPQRRFSTWLFQIAVNRCRDWWRERARRPVGGMDVEVTATSLAGPETRVAAALDVGRALGALPEPQREALILRYYHGLSEEETARVLGCPAGTVKSRVHYALKQVRDALSAAGDRR